MRRVIISTPTMDTFKAQAECWANKIDSGMGKGLHSSWKSQIFLQIKHIALVSGAVLKKNMK